MKFPRRAAVVLLAGLVIAQVSPGDTLSASQGFLVAFAVHRRSTRHGTAPGMCVRYAWTVPRPRAAMYLLKHVCMRLLLSLWWPRPDRPGSLDPTAGTPSANPAALPLLEVPALYDGLSSMTAWWRLGRNHVDTRPRRPPPLA